MPGNFLGDKISLYSYPCANDAKSIEKSCNLALFLSYKLYRFDGCTVVTRGGLP